MIQDMSFEELMDVQRVAYERAMSAVIELPTGTLVRSASAINSYYNTVKKVRKELKRREKEMRSR